MIIALVVIALEIPLLAIGLKMALDSIVDRKQREVEAKIKALAEEWLIATSDKEPSKLAALVDAMGTVVGSAAARSIMASLSASNSQVARVANGLSDELQGAQNPIMALLSGGKRGKGAAVARLTQLLLPMLGNKNGGGKAGNTDNFKFG